MKNKIIARVCFNVALSSTTLNYHCSRYLETTKRNYDNMYSYISHCKNFINDFLNIKNQLTKNFYNIDFSFDTLVTDFDSKYGTDKFNFRQLINSFYNQLKVNDDLMRDNEITLDIRKQVIIRQISCLELPNKIMRYAYE